MQFFILLWVVCRFDSRYCDTDVLTRGEVIQRLRCSDFLKTLQTRFDELQLEGQELDPPSDDEEWLAGGKDDPVDQEGVDTGGSESSLVRNTSHSALISSASPKAWPRARVKLFLPETGRAGDEMLATAPSGWISHVVVPKNATPGDFFEVDVENRPMRRAIVIRLEHYKFVVVGVWLLWRLWYFAMGSAAMTICPLGDTERDNLANSFVTF